MKEKDRGNYIYLSHPSIHLCCLSLIPSIYTYIDMQPWDMDKKLSKKTSKYHIVL